LGQPFTRARYIAAGKYLTSLFSDYDI